MYPCNKIKPDWTNECTTCGQTPVVPAVGLCGPCAWGEAELKEDWEYHLEDKCEDCDCEEDQ